MTIRWLSNFIFIVKCSSITSAAKDLYISPQALHQQMDALEDEIGCKLLIRSKKGVSLTKAGKVFYDGVKKIVNDYQKVVSDTLEQEKQAKNIIKIASGGLIQDDLFLDALMLFNKLYPNFSVKLFYSNYADEEDIDITINDLAFSKDVFHIFSSVQIDCFVIVQKEHPLAERKSVRIDELSSETLLIPPESSLKHLNWNIYEYLRDRLDIYSIEELPQAISSKALEATILSTNKVGISWGFRKNLHRGLRQIRIENSKMGYDVLYNAEHARQSTTIITFLEFIAQYYKDHWTADQPD